MQSHVHEEWSQVNERDFRSQEEGSWGGFGRFRWLPTSQPKSWAPDERETGVYLHWTPAPIGTYHIGRNAVESVWESTTSWTLLIELKPMPWAKEYPVELLRYETGLFKSVVTSRRGRFNYKCIEEGRWWEYGCTAPRLIFHPLGVFTLPTNTDERYSTACIAICCNFYNFQTIN